MAYLIATSKVPIFDGMPFTFKAACDCTSTDGLTVNYPTISETSSASASKTFVFKDSHGSTLTGIGNLFLKDAYVRVILDTMNGYAYVQNACTNSYLEEQFDALGNKIDGKAASSHNHSASNITSGTLPLTRGGTGAGSAAGARSSLGIGCTALWSGTLDAKGEKATFTYNDYSAYIVVGNISGEGSGSTVIPKGIIPSSSSGTIEWRVDGWSTWLGFKLSYSGTTVTLERSGSDGEITHVYGII